jgi:hypothetical protein
MLSEVATHVLYNSNLQRHFGSNPRSTLGRVVTKTRQGRNEERKKQKQKKLCGEAKERTKKDERFG